MVKVGEEAPTFSLPDTENRIRNLNEFLGQKVVLIFAVEAFAADSTKELCPFRDHMRQLTNLHAQIVGVNINPPSGNKQLAEKCRLHFPILADPNQKVTKAYDIKAMPSADHPLAKRAIFVLDEDGIVLHTWVAKKPSDEPNYDQIKEHLKPAAPQAHAPMVTPTVITFSRQIGSGGDEIAQHVSKMLGWSYVDKALMVEVGRKMGISEEDIVDFCEDTYRVQSFVDKLMLRRKPAKASFDIKNDAQIRKTLDEEQCLSTIQTVINNLASRGKTVIVGRGGQAVLKHKVGVLHVRVIAPQAVRVHRIMQSEGVDEEGAVKLMEENDRAASEYLQRFYNIDWDDPANYDMVINTAKLDLSTAALIIASAASQT
ncbi:MAG: cytidylate kinase family protein [Candidatus Bathyarchaeia archaeon]|jgi:peroxiredoxin/cytidylate kinase